MTFRKIPVNVPFWSNAESESKANIVAEQRRDVIKDVLGSTIRRPGLVVFATTELPEPADGMYYWESKDLVYVVSAGNLYSLSEGGVLTAIGTGLYGSGNHVSWAESANLELVTAGAIRKLFSTNGGRIVSYDGTTAAKLEGAEDPVLSSHIIMFDTYLLSNELSGEKHDESIFHSKVADPITFEGAYFSAENKPDTIKAMHTEYDEIALFGTKTLEAFYNNGVDPFAAIPGATTPQGTLSPWTIKMVDSAWFMLNDDKRLVRIDGRQAIVLSQAIDDLLSELPDLANAEGEIFTLKGKTLYLLTINERTFVYDFALREWVGEWGFWSKTTATYRGFKGRNFVNVKPWGLTLCTDPGTGKIYKLDFDTYQDYGNEIRSSVITGWIDHGTGREKRSNELRFKLKRGKGHKIAPTTVNPKLLVRWADNGSKVFSNYREILLGFEGEDDFFYSLFQLGSYRSRQYEIVCTDNVPFSIVDAEEDVELLR